jgi:protocatechuate 3,4-dioxygenase beta subunit
MLKDGGSLTGAVTGPTSATIDLYQNNILIRSATANPTYLMDHLSQGSYVAVASSPGYQTQSIGVIIGQGVTVLNFNLNSLTTSISGAVADNSSNPIEGAVLRIYQSNILIAQTSSNSSGNYTFSGIGSGSYTVTAAAAGYGAASQGVTVANPPATITGVNFSLSPDPGSISGLVQDTNGNPLSSAFIEVNYNNTVMFSTLSGVDGTYSITAVAPGSYVVHAHDPGYQFSSIGALILSNQNTTLNFTLAPDPGNLSGVVRDSASNPIPSALVEINYGNIVLFSTVTSSNGSYQFFGITPGVYSIHAHSPSYQSGIKDNVAIFSDQTTTLNFSLLQNPGTVQGNVSLGSSDAVGAAVELNQNNIVVARVLTDINGNYLLNGVAPGSYLMHAHYPGYFVGLASIIVAEGGSVTQNFTLVASSHLSISGSVFDFDTESQLPGAFLELYTQFDSKYVYIDTVVSTSNGTYQFGDLSSGSFIVSARALHYFPESSKVIYPTTTYNFYLKRILPAPRDLIGEVKVDKFLTQADRVHVLKWKPSILGYVESYNIYRNGSLIGNVSKNSILEYQDHKRNRYYQDVYKVYSVSKKGREVGYSEVSLK